MRTTVLLAALAMSGCLNVAKQVRLPDGSDGYTVSRCRSMNACYTKAAEVCDGAYEVVGSNATSSGAGTMVGGIGAFSSASGYEMAIRCKSK